MIVRKPNINLNNCRALWSKVPEFSMFFNGGSPIIPTVENYLNNVMFEVKKHHCADNPELEEELDIFIKQEATHARLHNQYNKVLYKAGFNELEQLEIEAKATLKNIRTTRSLAFNAAFCAGFESLATYLAKYFYDECGDYFVDAEPNSANLLLWHVAEEFEHRSVCHDAFYAVSKSYVTRIRGLLSAFYIIGGYFVRGQNIQLKLHQSTLSKQEKNKSKKSSQQFFWRLILWMIPNIIRIMKPSYHPHQLTVPNAINHALVFFQSEQPITTVFDVNAAT